MCGEVSHLTSLHPLPFTPFQVEATAHRTKRHLLLVCRWSRRIDGLQVSISTAGGITHSLCAPYFMFRADWLVIQSSVPQGPPYASTAAVLGGTPTVRLDVPIVAVFLLLFLLGAACHIRIYRLNLRRGHKFLISGFLFAFCMARVTTCIMRIIWATRPTNIRISLAATIFVTAGVVLVYLINIVLVQRILRAMQPHTCWHPLFNFAFLVIYALLVVALCLLISFTVQSVYTLDLNQHRIARDVQLYGGTLIAFVAFLPIPLILGGSVVSRNPPKDNFGTGRFGSKVRLLLSTAALLSLGAWFRAGTSYLPPRPRNHPAWYHSKACFYIFGLLIELAVVWLYVIFRVDKRFHVPDGSKGPGDYSAKRPSSEEMQLQETCDGSKTEDEGSNNMPRQGSQDMATRVSDAEIAVKDSNGKVV